MKPSFYYYFSNGFHFWVIPELYVLWTAIFSCMSILLTAKLTNHYSGIRPEEYSICVYVY